MADTMDESEDLKTVMVGYQDKKAHHQIWALSLDHYVNSYMILQSFDNVYINFWIEFAYIDKIC